MALSIKDPEADALARVLAEETGETLTQAIVVALRERLARVQRQKQAPARQEKMRALWDELERLPVLDARPVSALLPYDETGLPV
jgi:antitoxin VapB